MSQDVPADQAAVALAEAAAMAGHAPSVHNTQPWRWRIGGEAMRLYAERGRQLLHTDPSGRLLTISCGAALHHVRVCLAAEGWASEVATLPDPADTDLLAAVRITGRTPVSTASIRLVQTIQIRQTDRRPTVNDPVGAGALDEIARAVRAEGAHLHTLREADTMDLATAANRAQTIEAFDPQWREEIRYWSGDSSPAGLGVPAASIPSEPTHGVVPDRDFGREGTLPVSAQHDSAAVYAVLYTDEDTAEHWLRAGQALSAGWLRATELALSVLPMSAAVEVNSTRQMLRRLLANLGQPCLVLRLGMADPDHAGAPHTPRLPAAQTIEFD